jgi:hypothetical protein
MSDANFECCAKCKMKSSHFRLTQRLPYYIVHWNTEMVTISAFQSDTLVGADSSFRRLKIDNLNFVLFATGAKI